MAANRHPGARPWDPVIREEDSADVATPCTKPMHEFAERWIQAMNAGMTVEWLDSVTALRRTLG